MRKFIFILLAVLLTANSFSQVKISEMSEITEICADCWVPVVSGGQNKKIKGLRLVTDTVLKDLSDVLPSIKYRTKTLLTGKAFHDYIMWLKGVDSLRDKRALPRTVDIIGTGQSNMVGRDTTEVGTMLTDIDSLVFTVIRTGVVVADPTLNNIAPDWGTKKRNNIAWKFAKLLRRDGMADTVRLLVSARGGRPSYEWTPKKSGSGELTTDNQQLDSLINKLNAAPADFNAKIIIVHQGEENYNQSIVQYWVEHWAEVYDSLVKHPKVANDAIMILGSLSSNYDASINKRVDSLYYELLKTGRPIYAAKYFANVSNPAELLDIAHFSNSMIETIGENYYYAWKKAFYFNNKSQYTPLSKHFDYILTEYNSANKKIPLDSLLKGETLKKVISRNKIVDQNDYLAYYPTIDNRAYLYGFSNGAINIRSNNTGAVTAYPLALWYSNNGASLKGSIGFRASNTQDDYGYLGFGTSIGSQVSSQAILRWNANGVKIGAPDESTPRATLDVVGKTLLRDSVKIGSIVSGVAQTFATDNSVGFFNSIGKSVSLRPPTSMVGNYEIKLRNANDSVALFSELPQSGTFTPSISEENNVENVVVKSFLYTRINNIVSFSINIEFDEVAAGSAYFELSLPVLSAFTSEQDLVGVGELGYSIRAEFGNDTIAIIGTATGGRKTISLTGHYLIK